jgi:ribosome-binding factor A
MSQRIDRVDELLRQEIGRILAKEVQDPHVGFATVTDVETTPDLRHARVWVSVIGDADRRAETLAALERAMGYVRHELGTRLRLRRIPALHVALDDSAERGTRMLRILEELEQGHDAAGAALADAPRGESLPTPVPRLHRAGDAEPAADAEPGAAAERAADAEPGAAAERAADAEPAAATALPGDAAPPAGTGPDGEPVAVPPARHDRRREPHPRRPGGHRGHRSGRGRIDR